jgi:serine/threonine protein kinase
MEITNYKINTEIGRGGMATVFLAHDNKFDSNVAVKLLNKEFVHNDNIRKRFLAEARNMYKMSHPNIIKVTDLIEEVDTVAFVMEYIEGETLKDYLERKGKLSDEEIKNLFTQMLEALEYVHKQQLVHRDIKPSNFMINQEGQIKLMDFGIAKTTDTSSAEYTQTGTGVQMGTPMYMSPEQVKSSKDLGPASDIYSLGVVLWQMVTGRKPYNSNTISTVEIHIKILQESLEPTGTNWDKVIYKALEKKPSTRFSNAVSFKNAVEAVELIENDKTIIEKHFSQEPIPDQLLSQTNNSLINHATEKKLSKKYLKAGLVFLFLAVLFGMFYLLNRGGAIDGGTIGFVDSAKIQDFPAEKKYLIGCMKNRKGEYKYGFINASGNWVIPPTFAYIGDFHEGLAIAGINGKCGFIDTKGNWVIQPIYDDARDFHEGLATARINGKSGIIDTKGNWVIQPMFEMFLDFNEGFAMVRINRKCGFIDTKGNWVIPPTFAYIGDFHKGFAMARINGKCGFIDTKGNWVIQPIYDDAWDFHEGLAAAQMNGKFGFIDTKGNWVIKPSFEEGLGDFHGGLAKVFFNEKHGFINTSGNWVIQPIFETVGDFHEGLAAAQINGKSGFIDTKGNWVIQPIFETVEDFHEGLAKAIFNGKYGFIDIKGNWVIQPKYDYIFL